MKSLCWAKSKPFLHSFLFLNIQKKSKSLIFWGCKIASPMLAKMLDFSLKSSENNNNSSNDINKRSITSTAGTAILFSWSLQLLDREGGGVVEQREIHCSLFVGVLVGSCIIFRFLT